MTHRPSAAFLDFGTMGPGISTDGLDRIAETRYFDYTSAGELRERLAGRRVVIVNKTKLDERAISAAADLELIVVAATGTDNVDTRAAERRRVGVANIRDYGNASVAEHVFALILALTRRVDAYHRLVRKGGWSRSRSLALLDYPIRELAGRTMGIVGYGSLGRAVAGLARGFGMEVLVAGRPGQTDQLSEGREPFDDVLEAADVLSLHCPLTEANRKSFGAEQFRRMKPHALLINTARGALIDEDALVEALVAGEIGGAGLDVLPTEPPEIDHVLIASEIPNLIVTPHVAWAALEARQRAMEQVVGNVESFLGDGRLRRIV
jgi:glycerate dehydrogenase